MLKHALILIGVTVAAILFQGQLAHVVHWLLQFHNMIAGWLGSVFASDTAGHVIQGSLALIAIPIIASIVAAIAFWAFKRDPSPHILLTMWIAWMVMLVTMLAAR